MGKDKELIDEENLGVFLNGTDVGGSGLVGPRSTIDPADAGALQRSLSGEAAVSASAQ